MLQPAYGSASSSDHPVILVDTVRFINYWKKQCAPKERVCGLLGIISVALFKDKSTAIPTESQADHTLLSSGLDESLTHAIPSEMACGVGLDYKGELCFTNGRHRTVNMANLGAPYMPLQIYNEGIDEFKVLFEWKPL